MKKKVLIVLIVGIILIISITIFLILTNDAQNQKDFVLNKDTFSSCQPSTFKTSFAFVGTYTITVIGIENGTCHWIYSLKMSKTNDTKNCYYPPDKMSDKVFGHLFGEDKTGIECSSDLCKQQENLFQTYCS